MAGSFKLRFTIIGGPLIRLLYGTHFKFQRVFWVSGLMLFGAYLAIKWFVSQLDPLLFVLWALTILWTFTLGWTARLHHRINQLEERLETHESRDHVSPE